MNPHRLNHRAKLIALSLLLPLLAAPLAFLVRSRSARIPVKDRHVFISGGSSGIGLALARQATVEGARVSILARSAARLQEARDSIRLATGAVVAIFSADVLHTDAVAKAVEATRVIDMLVCNHVVFKPQELEKRESEEVRLMVEVNVMDTFHLINATLLSMKQRTKATGLPAFIGLVEHARLHARGVELLVRARAYNQGSRRDTVVACT
ncbi:hypothetical protein Cni_G21917 [Canna indica]|uniref:Uncharacterized protein n=1 Tax=Canna indica TaxID=4628 RepID=A0AAQ3KU60_9LILI|nr:hypothetical protein Cni_G21917 [Canna indica]